jgi:hypothetical protein
MRTLIGTLLLASCTTTTPAEPPSAPSVRARLATATELVLVAAQSTGDVTASHDTSAGWQAGSAPIAIASGAITLGVASDGSLAIDHFDIYPQPIALPQTVFGTPATLADVSVELASPTTISASWNDDDDATASASLPLQLQWSIEVNGDVIALGSPQLPPLPTTITLSGTGAVVDATIVVSASGTLWTWADLLQLDGLDLSLAATSDF